MDINEMTSKASKELDRAQECVENLSHTAGDVMDGAREETAAALDNAASSMRTTARHAAETVETLSGKTAGKLDSAAAYVRSHDLGAMLTSMRQSIVRHPAGFVIFAAGLGFVVGSAVARNKSKRD